MNAVILILSDARGIYIPRDFVTDNYNEIACDHCLAWGLDPDSWCVTTCANPEADGYWDAWDEILNNARYVDANGDVFTLYQEGDLWGLCVDRMTDEEKSNFGFDVE